MGLIDARYRTPEEANAYLEGVRYVNDSSIRPIGVIYFEGDDVWIALLDDDDTEKSENFRQRLYSLATMVRDYVNGDVPRDALEKEATRCRSLCVPGCDN